MPHILVVDDYPGLNATLHEGLASLTTCRVSCALTSNEALPLLDRDRPDLLVLDALMPGISGIDLADAATGRGIPVILMTGDHGLSEALTASGWRHLRKPFRFDALLAEVNAVLAEAAQNVAMVRSSLQRLRAAHGDARERLSEARLQSEAARQRRRDRETPV